MWQKEFLYFKAGSIYVNVRNLRDENHYNVFHAVLFHDLAQNIVKRSYAAKPTHHKKRGQNRTSADCNNGLVVILK
jgi:hypothetical protein